ncbi:diaminopimelate decarboxylase [Virgibacillus sp. C22-A2]|uniref:Diaminopimelate decarboxylase n=1 Tax=Virgibacillus tibetensis TaxID=3042313 RepID=A0ABU6KJX6_9BACI|nr:diaminopimelate decarboxylase [Virgibacillus sp. C22-A2]
MKLNTIDFQKLKAKYPTPLYLYSGEELEDNYINLRKKMEDNLEIFFSLKSNPNISIYSFLHNLGAKAEVSSLSELHTVLKCGTNPKDIIFLGPGKSIKEINACISNNIYALVCESIQELDIINNIAFMYNKVVDVAIRINPSVNVKGAKLVMGGKPRQFGIDEEELLELDDSFFEKFSNVNMIGFHTYMGTRILDEHVIVENTKIILKNAEVLSNKFNLDLKMVDIGGGLGVPYFNNEVDLNTDSLCSKLNPMIKEFKHKFPNARMIMELGRYLTAKAGVFVTKALYVKESRGEKFVIVDGGTNHHMAAVGIGSVIKRNFPIVCLSNLNSSPEYRYNICGPLCTPNDTLGKNVDLPHINRGDLIGIQHSGAYGPSASPTLFLSHGYPTEVLYYKNKDYLIRENDTNDDILAKQRLHNINNIILNN